MIAETQMNINNIPRPQLKYAAQQKVYIWLVDSDQRPCISEDFSSGI